MVEAKCWYWSVFKVYRAQLWHHLIHCYCRWVVWSVICHTASFVFWIVLFCFFPKSYLYDLKKFDFCILFVYFTYYWCYYAPLSFTQRLLILIDYSSRAAVDWKHFMWPSSVVNCSLYDAVLFDDMNETFLNDVAATLLANLLFIIKQQIMKLSPMINPTHNPYKCYCRCTL